MASADQSDEENLSGSDFDVSDGTASDELSDQENDPQRKPCRYYNKGGCRDAAKCPYLHVCMYAFKGNCRYGSACKRNHSIDGGPSDASNSPLDQQASADVKLTDGRCYQWQLYDGNVWLDVAHDHVIEAQYCLPHTRILNIYNTPYGVVSIDFFKMRVNGKKLRVRRLDDGNTKWIWYCTLGSKWIKYGDKDSKGNAGPVTSADIESKYQRNPASSFAYSIGTNNFDINFKDMRQLGKKRRRKVARRPLYQPQQAQAGSGQSAAASQSTGPLWQFEGNNGAWHAFKRRSGNSAECSVSSDDIEQKYQQNPQGSMTFKVKGQPYKLDFTAMTQTNQTNRSRRIRRLLV